MSKITKISSYTLKEEDRFFFDTNIWLYLLCPIGQYRQQLVDVYNTFFLDILKKGCKVYTSSIILSEFFNTYSRIEFQIKQQQEPTKYRKYKKDFRNSQEFEVLSKEICELIESKILKYSNKINDRFDTISLNDILVPNNNYDFNDIYLAQLCLREEIKILTNDSDFQKINSNIEIITA